MKLDGRKGVFWGIAAFNIHAFRSNADRKIVGLESTAYSILKGVMGFVPLTEGVSLAVRKEVRLLVVDDNREHFEALAEVADMYNPDFRIECRLASSTFEALEVLGEWEPSVVLVDLHSIRDALTVVRQLADQGRSVVATSVHRSPELSSVADQYGAVGYLSKSENPEDMEALVDFVAQVASPPDRSH